MSCQQKLCDKLDIICVCEYVAGSRHASHRLLGGWMQI